MIFSKFLCWAGYHKYFRRIPRSGILVSSERRLGSEGVAQSQPNIYVMQVNYNTNTRRHFRFFTIAAKFRLKYTMSAIVKS